MADEIDLANALMDSEVSRALNEIRHRAKEQSAITKQCVECGEDMPEARQQLGFKLCVTCAEYAEKKRSRFAD